MSGGGPEELGESIDTAAAGAKLEELRRRFLGSWLEALDDFNATAELLTLGLHPTTRAQVAAGEVSRLRGAATSRLVQSWHGLLDGAYRDAYRQGQDAWGPGRPLPRRLSPAAEAVLRREKQFAFRFAVDAARGPKPDAKRTFPASRRSAMFGLAIEGAYHRGAVDGAPPGQLIWWRLGDAQHCVWTPEARVLTKRGLVKIGDVVVGDEAWTHRSRWRPVLATHAVVQSRRTGSAKAVMVGGVGVTGDHELWTLDGWMPAERAAAEGMGVLLLSHAKFLAQFVEDPEALGAPHEEGPQQTPRELLEWSAATLREEDILARLCGSEPFGRVEAVGDLGPGHVVYDLTVAEDHSYVVEGVVVANCVDCPILAANSPYTKETLPTTPRSGSTECVWTPSSKVRTRRGDIPIRNVMTGDEVWTHRSRWRRVEAIRRKPAGERLGVLLGSLGLTEEHRAWTADGWLQAGKIAKDGLQTLHLHDAERLREVLGADALGSPYQALPSVRVLLSLREDEGSARRLLQELRPVPGGSEELGRPEDAGKDDFRPSAGGPEAEDSPSGKSLGEGLPQSEAGGLPLRRLLGGEPEADDLPPSMDLGSGKRADTRGFGHPSSERGSDRRPSRELGAIDSGGAQPGAHDGWADRRDACRPGPEADGNADLDMSGLRAAVPAVRARGEAPEKVLLQSLPREAVLFDLTVEEDHSFLIDGVFVENCWTSCRCHLTFSQAEGTRRVQPPTPDPTSPGALEAQERARDLRDRVEGPLPTPPPGRRLPDEQEHRAIQDLRHRMAFASRRADRASAAGNLVERDRWLKTRSQLNGELIRFEGDRGIWAPPTFSDSEILTSADVRAGDVDWMTDLRGIDGTTVHRAQAAAVEQAAKAARNSLGDLLGDLPPDGGPVVPDFDELLRRAGAPSSSFTGEFGDAVVPWPDPRALTEAVEVADPADRLVLSVVGLGARATLAAIPAMLEECRSRALDVQLGPVDEGWEEVVLRFGAWVQGRGDDVRALVAGASQRVGGRGLEVAPWQP